MEIEVDFSGHNLDADARAAIEDIDTKFGTDVSDFVEKMRRWLDEGNACTPNQLRALRRMYDNLEIEELVFQDALFWKEL